MRLSKVIRGHTVVVNCRPDLRLQGEWLLGEYDRMSSQFSESVIRPGAKLQVGWSLLTLVAQDSEFIVHEPDFESDPLTAIRPDVSSTLEIMAQQNDLVRSLALDHTPVKFQDKIVVLKNCLGLPRIYMERQALTPGDSGWYIGDVEKKGESGELEGMRVFNLLKLRPFLLRFLTLPEHYLVVISGDRLEALLNDRNERIAIESDQGQLN